MYAICEIKQRGSKLLNGTQIKIKPKFTIKKRQRFLSERVYELKDKLAKKKKVQANW